MGLDLFVREAIGHTSDAEGRTVWQTVELCNLRGCHNILDRLSSLRGGFDNCATMSFDDEELFHDVYDDLIEDRKNYKNYKAFRFKTQTDEEFKKMCDNAVSELDYEISELEAFFEQENIKEDTLGTRTFEIHAWW